LKACRDIVTFFHSSSQAMEKLLSKQAQGKALKPIQDVATRWWSTYSMLIRLLRLMTYLQLLEEEGEGRCNLTPEQWVIVKDLAALLHPFMVVQKLLEGESYVTISFIPFIIYKIRLGLQQAADDLNNSQHVANTATRMLAEFNVRFGTGIDGTVATENLTLGQRRRPKGMHMLQLMACFLDPRMKAGVGISAEDKESIWNEIKTNIIALYLQHDAIGGDAIRVQDQPILQQPQIQQFDGNDSMFDELNVYHKEVYNPNNKSDDEHGYDDEAWRQQRVAAAEAEVILYQRDPGIRLQDSNNRFNCPLKWWKQNQSKYKMLSILAAKLLCIPATSAPSEWVFSVAGLTIAKDRARLSSEHANEILFLHDAKPAIRKYEAARATL